MVRSYANIATVRDSEKLAYHYEFGTDFENAVEWLWHAGEKSRRTYLNADAADYLERGLTLLEDAGPPDWRAGMGAALHESHGHILELSGKHDEGSEAWEVRSGLASAGRIPHGHVGWVTRTLE